MSNTQQEAFDLIAESTLLSIILLRPQEVSALKDLDYQHFYGNEYKEIFRGIQILANNNKDINAITIVDAIKSKVDETEKQSIDTTLQSLYSVIDISKIITYSVSALESIIIRDWTIREIKKYAQLLLEVTSNNDCMVPKIIEYTGRINELEAELTNQDKNPLVHIKDATRELVRAYKDINTKPSYLPTYIPVVDHALAGGGEDDDLKEGGIYGITVLLGRSGARKTTLAQFIAMENAKNGVGCIFFSLELTQIPLTAKFISQQLEINATSIINKKLNSEEFQKLDNSIEKMEGIDLYISTKLSMTAQQIKAAVEPYKDKVGLIVIDYAGLMKSTRENASPYLGLNDNLEILKSIYDEWGIVVLLICQATRTKPDKAKEPPNETEIEGSEKVRRDASVIMVIHPHDIYPDEKSTLSIRKNRFNRPHPDQNIEIVVDQDTNKITGVTGGNRDYNSADATDF